MTKRFLAVFILSVALLLPAAAMAQSPIRFGVPPWPGVTVKTEVVAQILNAMGYETQQFEVGPPIIYKGLTNDEIDAYTAAWIPNQDEMFQPLKEKDAIVVAGKNLDQANTGMCVPTYTWEAGVHSVADLDKHADKFNHQIHGIEAGSGMHTTTEKIIADDVAGLGDWSQVGSTTPAMLSVVMNKAKRDEWVVFHCWQPHWMNIAIDMKYLEGVPGTETLLTKSVVYTVVSTDFAERYPQAFKFFEQFEIEEQTQSRWIHAFGYEKQPAEKVASDWIAANMDTVSAWLEGVKTADGKQPAIEAVRGAFK